MLGAYQDHPPKRSIPFMEGLVPASTFDDRGAAEADE
jgi:hypothetical protein